MRDLPGLLWDEERQRYFAVPEGFAVPVVPPRRKRGSLRGDADGKSRKCRSTNSGSRKYAEGHGGDVSDTSGMATCSSYPDDIGTAAKSIRTKTKTDEDSTSTSDTSGFCQTGNTTRHVVDDNVFSLLRSRRVGILVPTRRAPSGMHTGCTDTGGMGTSGIGNIRESLAIKHIRLSRIGDLDHLHDYVRHGGTFGIPCIWDIETDETWETLHKAAIDATRHECTSDVVMRHNSPLGFFVPNEGDPPVLTYVSPDDAVIARLILPMSYRGQDRFVGTVPVSTGIPPASAGIPPVTNIHRYEAVLTIRELVLELGHHVMSLKVKHGKCPTMGFAAAAAGMTPGGAQIYRCLPFFNWDSSDADMPALSLSFEPILTCSVGREENSFWDMLDVDWDIETGKASLITGPNFRQLDMERESELWSMIPPAKRAFSCIGSPSGDVVFVSGHRDGMVRVWDTRTNGRSWKRRDSYTATRTAGTADFVGCSAVGVVGGNNFPRLCVSQHHGTRTSGSKMVLRDLRMVGGSRNSGGTSFGTSRHTADVVFEYETKGASFGKLTLDEDMRHIVVVAQKEKTIRQRALDSMFGDTCRDTCHNILDGTEVRIYGINDGRVLKVLCAPPESKGLSLAAPTPLFGQDCLNTCRGKGDTCRGKGDTCRGKGDTCRGKGGMSNYLVWSGSDMAYVLSSECIISAEQLSYEAPDE